jgi:hypothetical protein
VGWLQLVLHGKKNQDKRRMKARTLVTALTSLVAAYRSAITRTTFRA